MNSDLEDTPVIRRCGDVFETAPDLNTPRPFWEGGIIPNWCDGVHSRPDSLLQDTSSPFWKDDPDPSEKADRNSSLTLCTLPAGIQWLQRANTSLSLGLERIS